jgi:hypothetical protein
VKDDDDDDEEQSTNKHFNCCWSEQLRSFGNVLTAVMPISAIDKK